MDEGSRLHARGRGLAAGANAVRLAACRRFDVAKRGVPPTQVAEWAGHSVEILLKFSPSALTVAARSYGCASNRRLVARRFRAPLAGGARHPINYPRSFVRP